MVINSLEVVVRREKESRRSYLGRHGQSVRFYFPYLIAYLIYLVTCALYRPRLSD